jgi:hypothetical protein
VVLAGGTSIKDDVRIDEIAQDSKQDMSSPALRNSEPDKVEHPVHDRVTSGFQCRRRQRDDVTFVVSHRRNVLD